MNDTICKTHPDAPHGFCRSESETEDRYVCECEFWEPPVIKTIEIAPHIYAKGLAEHIWNAYNMGSVRSKVTDKQYSSPLVVLKKEDLYETIKEFMLKDDS